MNMSMFLRAVLHSDLYLMSQAKHFVVIPSSYNWWGAWLNDKKMD